MHETQNRIQVIWVVFPLPRVLQLDFVWFMVLSPLAHTIAHILFIWGYLIIVVLNLRKVLHFIQNHLKSCSKACFNKRFLKTLKQFVFTNSNVTALVCLKRRGNPRRGNPSPMPFTTELSIKVYTCLCPSVVLSLQKTKQGDSLST